MRTDFRANLRQLAEDCSFGVLTLHNGCKDRIINSMGVLKKVVEHYTRFVLHVTLLADCVFNGRVLHCRLCLFVLICVYIVIIVLLFVSVSVCLSDFHIVCFYCHLANKRVHHGCAR